MERIETMDDLIVSISQTLKGIEDGTAIRGAASPDAALTTLEALAAELDSSAEPLLNLFIGNQTHLLASASTESLVDLVLGEVQIDAGRIRKYVWVCSELFKSAPIAAGLPIAITPADLSRVIVFLFGLVLRNELFRRQKESESRIGGREARLVREILVNKNDPSTLKAPLEEAVKLSLWNTAKFPRLEGLDGKREKQSVAAAALVEVLQGHWEAAAVALTPKGLKAITDGDFGKVLWKVRDRVRQHLKSEASRSKPLTELLPQTQELEHFRESFAEWDEGKVFAFMERLRSTLTTRQKVFLEIRLNSDSQVDTARRMEISASAASQLRKSVGKAIADLFKGEPLA